jgi:hypothetical protein
MEVPIPARRKAAILTAWGLQTSRAMRGVAMGEKVYCKDLKKPINRQDCYHARGNPICKACPINRLKKECPANSRKKIPTLAVSPNAKRVIQEQARAREIKIKGAGRNKPDLRLTYWKNWAIFDPIKGECLVNFAPEFFKGYSGNIDQLCRDIKLYPEQALRDPVIRDYIALVRENEYKGALPRGSFDKVLKAMKIDWRRQPFSRSNPKDVVLKDLLFFRKMLNRESGSVEKAIFAHIEATEDHRGDGHDEMLKKIFAAYNKAYQQLTAPGKLNPDEAIRFLEFAGENIDNASEFFLFNPQDLMPPSRRNPGADDFLTEEKKRPLLFVKGEYIVKCYLGGLL